MPANEHQSERIPFTFATPILSVEDGAQSLEHYVQVLGFEVAWQWSDDRGFDEGGAPTFMCVCRGEVSLFLAEKCQGQPGGWVMLNVKATSDVDAVYEELAAKGARILEPPRDCSWGMRELWVQDLDGNVLRIGAPVSEGDSA